MSVLKPGAMTNLFYKYRPGKENVVESMRRLREIGFEIMDGIFDDSFHHDLM